MKRNHRKSPALLLAFSLALAAMLTLGTTDDALIGSALAGELDLSDAQNAKLSRHKAKERVSKNEAQKDYSVGRDENSDELEDEECGTVDIGNVVNNKGFGGPKQIDVIITGDIINANNDCN